MNPQRLKYSPPTYRGRRRSARYQVSIIVEGVKDHPESQTSIIDISPLGAQLETDFPMEKKELIEFNLPTQEAGMVPIFAGRVEWISKVSSIPLRYRVGISFINPVRGLSGLLFGGSQPFAPEGPEGEGIKKSWWRRLLGR